MQRTSNGIAALCWLVFILTVGCAKHAPTTHSEAGVPAVVRLYVAPHSFAQTLPEDGELFHLTADEDSAFFKRMSASGAELVADHNGTLAFGEEITLSADDIRVELAARNIGGGGVAFSGRCNCPTDIEVEEAPADGNGSIADEPNDRFVILPEASVFGIVLGRNVSGDAVVLVTRYERTRPVVTAVKAPSM